MPKRDLFEELKHSLEDVKAFEQKKMTLRTTSITPKERKVLSASQIRTIS